jgi:nicotinate-nucleotide pyrophosphorylase (carboxylating)
MIARISGPARGVLSAERVALNYLMHLSGIATHTARFADVIAHTQAKVTCTRKTIPGLRAVEKYAVRCGGGSSHRYGLDDAILIKDNHIAVAGGIAAALKAAKAFAGHLVKVEIEVDTLEQIRRGVGRRGRCLPARQYGTGPAARGGGDEQAASSGGPIILEASGNVNLDTIKAIAETGVDYISTSKITMAAPTLDIGLDMAIG